MFVFQFMLALLGGGFAGVAGGYMTRSPLGVAVYAIGGFALVLAVA